ncbi:MAG: hypothetical protein JSU00_04175 [Acidobacteria bacterium]|nr:hypothetical protein [Acidobacteriota bacterium]
MGVRRNGVSLAFRSALLLACAGAIVASAQRSKTQAHSGAVTFHGDVAPILERRCQGCHADGSTPLATYNEVKPKAEAIVEAIKSRRMPPWFADPKVGEFANEPRLSADEIRVIESWLAGGTLAGKAGMLRHVLASTPEPLSPDLVLTASKPLAIEANNALDYRYLILSLPFTFDRWIRAAEIRPSNRRAVHHAVLYVRDPRSKWLREQAAGEPYAPRDAEALARARAVTDEVLAVYAPGADGMLCPDGMAKRVPAGSDLVLQIHYARSAEATADQPEVGLAIAPETPKKRVVTLPFAKGAAGRPLTTRPLLVDALLVSLFPRTYLPGVGADFDIVEPGGISEPVLKVAPNTIGLQLNYAFKSPRPMYKGGALRWTPRPAAGAAASEPGDDSDESMTGYYDIAVDLNVSTQRILAQQ